jgi:hypothetical protein
VLTASTAKLVDRLTPEDLVLDVGGWARPFGRADWVLDLLPYETRGLYGYEQGDRDDERFSAATWVVRDICDRQPWPFGDKQFDFAICSHTLEDLRDPIWVCQELQRVAKAGYIEVPSRLVEQTHGVEGDYAGWGHHHWLIDVSGAGIQFVFKHHILHGDRRFQVPHRTYQGLTEEAKVQQLWWNGAFEVAERIFIDPPEALHEYLMQIVVPAGSHAPPMPRRGAARLRSRVARRLGLR